MPRSLIERRGDVAVADRRRCPAQDLQADLRHLAAPRPIGSGTPDLGLDRVRHANTPRAAIRIPCACSCRRGCPLQPRRSAHSLTEQPQPRMCQTHVPAGLLIPPSASIAARTRRLACNCRSVGSDARPPPSGTSIGRARSGSRPANWKSLWKARPASCMASVTAPDRSSLRKLSTVRRRSTMRPSGSRTSSSSRSGRWTRFDRTLTAHRPTACRPGRRDAGAARGWAPEIANFLGVTHVTQARLSDAHARALGRAREIRSISGDASHASQEPPAQLKGSLVWSCLSNRRPR